MSLRAVASIALLALSACSTPASDEAMEKGKEVVTFDLNPFGSTEVFVTAVETRGPYALATLRSRSIDLRFFAPRSDDCAHVLRPEAQITYAKSGTYGRFQRGDYACDAVGIASLRKWRDGHRRSQGRPAPRGTARYQVIYKDADVVLLRGQFPYATRVPNVNGYDIVAMIPNSEACARPISRSEATIEFRSVGSDPFKLIGPDGFCPIVGFAEPLTPPGS